MKIKRYFGNTNKEAMDKLKKELGENAVILHTRKIKRPGMLSFLRKPLVEIVAAIDEENREPQKSKLQESQKLQKTQIKKENRSKSQLNTDLLFEGVSKSKERIADDEVVKLRQTVESLVSSIENTREDTGVYPEEVKLLQKRLTSNGLDYENTTKILNELMREHAKIEGRINYENLLIKLLKKHLGPVKPITLNNKQKIVIFVGPTGVGKTTTLAKIAAQYALVNKEKIGLITADTYRIAAVEQLKTYSEILGIPLKIIYDGSEIVEAVQDYYDKELILVDTAGRSHKNNDKVKELKEMLGQVKDPEIFLVLSSTTNKNTIDGIIETYKFINDYKLIFTKLDESDNYGIVMSTCYEKANPLSYITTGQSVPEDIKLANIDEIAKSLLGENKDV
ncbi:MAG: flagellar biosynthesis protein FlhF [Tissierellales bacterium]|jgi:flagellar biosynthesis protein FlhF|nr:flagellar biosynthesis protein FlhF [Tissierellales bacterium]